MLFSFPFFTDCLSRLTVAINIHFLEIVFSIYVLAHFESLHLLCICLCWFHFMLPLWKSSFLFFLFVFFYFFFSKMLYEKYFGVCLFSPPATYLITGYWLLKETSSSQLQCHYRKFRSVLHYSILSFLWKKFFFHCSWTVKRIPLWKEIGLF